MIAAFLPSTLGHIRTKYQGNRFIWKIYNLPDTKTKPKNNKCADLLVKPRIFVDINRNPFMSSHHPFASSLPSTCVPGTEDHGGFGGLKTTWLDGQRLPGANVMGVLPGFLRGVVFKGRGWNPRGTKKGFRLGKIGVHLREEIGGITTLVPLRLKNEYAVCIERHRSLTANKFASEKLDGWKMSFLGNVTF